MEWVILATVAAFSGILRKLWGGGVAASRRMWIIVFLLYWASISTAIIYPQELRDWLLVAAAIATGTLYWVNGHEWNSFKALLVRYATSAIGIAFIFLIGFDTPNAVVLGLAGVLIAINKYVWGNWVKDREDAWFKSPKFMLDGPVAVGEYLDGVIWGTALIITIAPWFSIFPPY